MSFTQFSTDVKNLENLGTNRPNKDLGLSGLQLRQKFDKAVSDIKAFINGTLIVELESALGAGNIGITTPAGMQSQNVQQAIAELYDAATTIADAAVTTQKIANGAVESSKLASGAVTVAKMADNAVSTVYTATVTADWEGTEAPYTQTVQVSGITADDKPIIDIVPSDTFATAEQQCDAWSVIYRIETGTDSLTVYATEPTEVSIPIQIRAVRK